MRSYVLWTIPVLVLIAITTILIASEVLIIQTQNEIQFIPTQNAKKTNPSHEEYDAECQWYYNKDWWKHFNITETFTKDSVDPFRHISSAYNYSVPNPSYPVPEFHSDSCKYQGKILNIGIQKTGTTTMMNALQQLGYKCSKHGRSWIPETCYYHELGHPYKHMMGYPLSFWRAFSADDITYLFANKEYHNELYLNMQDSQLFMDGPWCFMYPLFDAWYDRSRIKYIYTMRATTYNRVNSVIKFHLMKRCRRKKGKHCSEPEFLKEIYWGSPMESRISNHHRLEELVMLMARLYEKHHENVMRYFGMDRIGETFEDDVLILCLECDKDEILWLKLMRFLGCDIDSERNEKLLQSEFPWDLAAYQGLGECYVPRDFDLNWREYNWSDDVKRVFDNIYDNALNATERMYQVARDIWGIDMRTQADVDRPSISFLKLFGEAV